MTISVVIPSYGQAQYLRQAIDSVLDQTRPAYEIIVVDDGSMDGSLEIAKEYQSKVKVISQVNKGLASARNAGIMNAQGDWILPLDADDTLMPEALERINSFQVNETQADVIGLSIHCLNLETGESQYTILMIDPKFDDFKEGNRLAYCAVIRRSVLLETGGYSPKMDTLGGWEDLHLWYDLMRRGKKIVTMQEPLVLYRVKQDSMWKRTQGREKELWAQINKDFPATISHAKYA